VTITIIIHVVASSTNMTTSPEKGLWNHIHVRVITRKKKVLDGIFVSIVIIVAICVSGPQKQEMHDSPDYAA
jgi:hypothetical protein